MTVKTLSLIDGHRRHFYLTVALALALHHSDCPHQVFAHFHRHDWQRVEVILIFSMDLGTLPQCGLMNNLVGYLDNFLNSEPDSWSCCCSKGQHRKQGDVVFQPHLPMKSADSNDDDAWVEIEFPGDCYS